MVKSKKHTTSEKKSAKTVKIKGKTAASAKAIKGKPKVLPRKPPLKKPAAKKVLTVSKKPKKTTPARVDKKKPKPSKPTVAPRAAAAAALKKDAARRIAARPPAKKQLPIAPPAAAKKKTPPPAPPAAAKKPIAPPAAVPVSTPMPAKDSPLKTKMLPRAFMVELAAAIRAAVAPAAREARGREIVGTATSGDATFELDRIAEKALLTFLKNARIPAAYYSEDSGYTTFTNTQPKNLLIIDPIDGTRAAKSGFEGCTVSIASTRVIERPCMADVDSGCVMEILGDRTFYAERGNGARITQDGHVRRPKLSRNADLEMIAWSMTVPARPAELIFPTAARLIDLSSLKGGFFSCNSTSYSLMRLLTNQLDACVDFANRFLRDIPELVKDFFINAGRGVPISIAPYDIAAAVLIAQEAGCTVTDAYGKSFDDVLLLDTSTENHRSMIAASNAELHKKLLGFFDTRITQFEQLLKHRAKKANS